eukprot:CAMPEP_0114134328 /NCGR_PEP_ID=MMETSP0043_2-20121206/14095_1 /TAXON_ID=464988 /ORGANISM="Hemiselmis andersenii, Strain CCMP644" /LENGTH=864 /DNA_ID=CAMNT_0001227953 /DNA_START=33 /DNA_END=2623 /DNA_ORIENTATION=+
MTTAVRHPWGILPLLLAALALHYATGSAASPSSYTRLPPSSSFPSPLPSPLSQPSWTQGALLTRRSRALPPLAPLRGGAPTSSSPLPIADPDAPPTPLDSDATVTLKLFITYGIENGEVVATGPTVAFGGDDLARAVRLKRVGDKKDNVWGAEVKVPLGEASIEYHYVIKSRDTRYESRICPRSVSIAGLPAGSTVDVRDGFRSAKYYVLATSCFSRAIFGRGNSPENARTENKLVETGDLSWPELGEGQTAVRLHVFAPRVSAGHSVWVRGNTEGLGKWSKEKMCPMVHIGGRIYVGQVVVDKADKNVEFKLAVVDNAGSVVCEEKDTHKLSIAPGSNSHITQDVSFVYPNPTYKTAGVALPVSGIRSEASTGIGEFLDLKKVADWCSKTGLQIIQILPINDSGEDPSPYSASSSFALHPSYVTPIAVAGYYSSKMGLDMSGITGWATSLVEKLNHNKKIDYARVLGEKQKIMDAIYDLVGRDQILADPGFQEWLSASESWVKVYAAFKVQLVKEKSFNNKWFDTSCWSKGVSETEAIVSHHSEDYDKVVRVYFTQYHLHLQLLEASKYAESLGVAIKGDIPIGVTRCSSDVWAEPNLFKLDMNCGAPGDPEQNWGFPPYNWGEMHRDGCLWWKRRLRHMDQYFHAYRIDHVLGFFRMWEIPQRGGGGKYNPSSGLREAGLKNLRAIQTASSMLICGEDLGNVPDEVPPVLLELGICGLRIQRWCDGQTWKYPYLCVGASSCHDCSPCRLWWNEEWGGAEGWYNYFVGKGQCPGGPPDWISQKIVKMHCEGTSLLTINPIQDYVDMWQKLRSPDPKQDMINRPGHTDGCWTWRCHLRIDDLLKEDNFNGFIHKMMGETKRGVV